MEQILTDETKIKKDIKFTTLAPQFKSFFHQVTGYK